MCVTNSAPMTMLLHGEEGAALFVLIGPTIAVILVVAVMLVLNELLRLVQRTYWRLRR